MKRKIYLQEEEKKCEKLLGECRQEHVNIVFISLKKPRASTLSKREKISALRRNFPEAPEMKSSARS